MDDHRKHYCRICGGQVIDEYGWINVHGHGKFWLCPTHKTDFAVFETREVGWIALCGTQRLVLGPYPYD